MRVIAHCSICLIVVGPTLLFSACEKPAYKEQEIKIVMPDLPVAVQKEKVRVADVATPVPASETATPIKPVNPTVPLTREAVEANWNEVQQFATERGLTQDDLVRVAPAARLLPGEVATGEPKVLARKIAAVKKAIEAVVINRKFVNEKLDRTRTLLNNKELTPEKLAQMNDRLEVVPRLLGDENYELANEALTFIQEELAELGKPANAQEFPTLPTETPAVQETPAFAPTPSQADETNAPRSPS
jgi:hypothetical protein